MGTGGSRPGEGDSRGITFPGLRVWVTGRPAGAQQGDDVKATLKSADQPLTLNAWDQAF